MEANGGSGADGDSSRESGIGEGEGQTELVPEIITGENGEKEQNKFGCGPGISFERVAGDGGKEQTIDDRFVLEDHEEVPVASRSCDNRSSVKKQDSYDSAGSQQRRRNETLQWQKQRRDEILDKIRQLDDSAFSDSETEEEMDFVQTVRQNTPVSQLEGIVEDVVEQMEVVQSKSNRSKRRHTYQNNRQHYKQAPCRPMLSEWLIEKPEDFDEMWLGVICPVGKRCIVMASHARTKIFSRNDEYLGSYKSLLPGGCRYNYKDSQTNRNRGITILDCIWSPKTETFYGNVLDLICWNSHSCVNCDTDYRQFFLHSKFSENLELLERSKLNPFPFKLLPFFATREMPLVMASSLMFPEDVDGILLFHKETFYISETNPLCLWILLNQVEPLLNIYVSPELLCRQKEPKNLSSRKKQMKKHNNSSTQQAMDHLPANDLHES